MHLSVSVFEEARKRLLNQINAGKRIKTLFNTMIDELSAGRLYTSEQCWLVLYEEMDTVSFSDAVKILNELSSPRGVSIGMAMMPGNSSSSPGLPALSLAIPLKNRVLLMPLCREGRSQICQFSRQFLGSNCWLEPVANESPDMIFRQIVTFMTVDPAISPPPLTGLISNQQNSGSEFYSR